MIAEKIIIGDKFPLDGLLTLPDGDAPFPAIVLVHGSGPNDIDEKIGNCYCFRDLAEGFAERGIATIRYNKRTKTYGKQMVKGKKDTGDLTVWDETIEDALFATEILRKDSRIDPNKIYIAGHSMGAMLAPRIDAEGGNYTGLILLAGSPRRLEEIMIDQQDEAIKNMNPVIKWIANKQIKKFRANMDGMYEMSDEQAKKTNVLGKYIKVYYLKEWGEKPAVNYLQNLTKPIFITQGDADFHVSVDLDFNKYKEIMADKPNATFKLYPNLNHLFMQTVYGNNISKGMKEYKKPQKVEGYVMDDITAWIKGEFQG